MPWKIHDQVSQRLELVALAPGGSVTFTALCARFGVSRKTGYKYLANYRARGIAGLLDQPRSASRRSNQTARRVEKRIVALRGKHPTWGPRKLKQRLQVLGSEAASPAHSTFGRILSRCGCIAPADTATHRPVQRFERAEPNQLWQMDFKGHFALQRGGRCHPLTVLDDCSRYLLGLQACGDEQGRTVRTCLEAILRTYGLPESILCDNGPPWGGGHTERSHLEVWLMRLGIGVIHGRPFHPQTQGKDERFHRTLKADLLTRHDWRDLAQAQPRFTAYRRLYNHERPHEALGLAVPAARYRASPRGWPARLLEPEYATGTSVRPVKSKGEITFRNRFYYVGRAFAGCNVALHPCNQDGVFRLCYASFTLGLIDLRTPDNLPKGHYHPLQSCLQKV
jgi:transposase InsO family protein